MGDKFQSGLKATNDIYAKRAGLVPPDKGENLVEVAPPPDPIDPATAGLAPVDGAPKPVAKKAPAKKAAAKKAAPKAKAK